MGSSPRGALPPARGTLSVAQHGSDSRPRRRGDCGQPVETVPRVASRRYRLVSSDRLGTIGVSWYGSEGRWAGES